MTYLTDFADQAVIIPLVLAVALALAAQGWRRGAIAWLLVVAVTFTVTLALKLIFLSCAPVFGPLDVRSPSGHTAAAAVVMGGLTVLLTRRRYTILPVAVLAATLIGFSRLVLGLHTPHEVIVGALIGVTGALGIRRFIGAPPVLALTPLISVIVIVAGLFHGLHLPAEAAIHQTAFQAAQFIPVCQEKPVFADARSPPHPDTR